MPKFTVNAEPQISELIEVEVNGHTYKVRKISRRMLREIEAAQAENKDVKGLGSAESAFRQLDILLGPEAKDDIDEMDIFEFPRLLEWITEQYEQRATKTKPATISIAPQAAPGAEVTKPTAE